MDELAAGAVMCLFYGWDGRDVADELSRAARDGISLFAGEITDRVSPAGRDWIS